MAVQYVPNAKYMYLHHVREDQEGSDARRESDV